MKQPIIKPTGDGRRYELVEDYPYTIQDGRTIYVPAGYVFDGASIPRPLWGLYSPFTGLYLPAALCHDWLCELGHDWVDAANIFLEIMEMAGVRFTQRYVMYWAVRANQLFRDDINMGRVNYLRHLQNKALAERGIEIEYVL